MLLEQDPGLQETREQLSVEELVAAESAADFEALLPWRVEIPNRKRSTNRRFRSVAA